LKGLDGAKSGNDERKAKYRASSQAPEESERRDAKGDCIFKQSSG
jgi:hypothetical protein